MPAEDAPANVYDFSFGEGLGAWSSWLPPSLIRGDTGTVPNYVRLQAPGTLDPNHIDGIGNLWLVAHLSTPTIGSPGIFDLRGAEIDITIRGTDFDADGAQLFFWISSYIPQQDVFLNFYVGLQSTNWANTGNDLAGRITSEWQTLTVSLSTDPADWTYAGNYVSGQGDWGHRYEYFDLASALGAVDATIHLVMVGDSPDETPTGFLDIADIAIRTVNPVTPSSEPRPHLIAYGVEDEVLTGQLTNPSGEMTGATFTLVEGSVRNGSVVIDPSTGAYTFTPSADYYGPTDFNGAATFQYVVTDGAGTSPPLTAYLFIAGINDAPVAAVLDEGFAITADAPFEYVLFQGSDIDNDRLTFSIVEGSVTNGTMLLDARTGRYVFTPDAGFSGIATFQYAVSDGQLSSAPKTVSLAVAEPDNPPHIPTFFEAIDNYLLAGDLLGFVRWTIYLAQEGDIDASYHYGSWLADGRFVAKDTAMAAVYLDRARDVSPDAVLQLAALYTAGDGVARDYAYARELLESLPDNAEAHYRLGILDNLGFGAVRDDAAAVGHFLIAAKLGNASAMYTLGRRYLAGEGVPLSAEDAYFWLGVGLRFGGGPDMDQFRELLIFNMNQAAADLGDEDLETLDAAIASWSAGTASPVNDAPVAVEDSLAGVEDETAVFTASSLTGNDSDSDGDAFAITGVSSAIGGVATLNEDGTIGFVPDADFNGAASFEYQIEDGEGAAAVGVATVNVAAVNDGPVAVDDMLAAVEDETAVFLAESLTGNDSDIDDDELAIVSVSNAVAGVATLNEDGTVSFTPDAEFSGVASFEYEIEDGNGGTAGGVATVNVAAVDDSAVARDDAFATDEVSLAGAGSNLLDDNGLGPDLDIDSSLAVTEVNDSAAAVGSQIQLASGALLTVNADGTFSYDPNGAFNSLTPSGGGSSNSFAVDSFTYTLSDGAKATAQVRIEGILSPGDQIRGSALDDTIFGLGGNDVLLGGAGLDALFGLGGADILFGEAGNDILNGGLGSDIMNGGPGNDAYIVDSIDDIVREDASQGRDVIYAAVSYFLREGMDIEILTAEDRASTATINLTGNSLDNAILGNAGNNVLNGGGGADVLLGYGGSDILNGGLGGDLMNGGAGDDVYIVDSIDDIVQEVAGEGRDILYSGMSYYLREGMDVEVLAVDQRAGTAPIDLTGNGIANTLHGNDGANVLNGGAGSDVLVGWGGADTFQFTDAPGNGNLDIIVDFLPGSDRIALDNAVFAGLPGGALAPGAFRIGSAAADADDRIIYNSATGSLFFDPDGAGGAAAVQFGILQAGLITLTANDFLVI